MPRLGIRRVAERAADRYWHRRIVQVGASIHPTARVARGSLLTARTSIGHHTAINGPASFVGSGSIEIGPYCAIGRGLTVVSANHDTRFPNIQFTLHREHGFVDLDIADDVTVGAACWFGDNVSIMAGVTIGSGAVIAASAVVTKDVEPYTIVAGVPAKPVRERCTRPVATELLELAWWDWPDARIERNRAFFETEIASTSPKALRETVLP